MTKWKMQVYVCACVLVCLCACMFLCMFACARVRVLPETFEAATPSQFPQFRVAGGRAVRLIRAILAGDPAEVKGCFPAWDVHDRCEAKNADGLSNRGTFFWPWFYVGPQTTRTRLERLALAKTRSAPPPQQNLSG